MKACWPSPSGPAPRCGTWSAVFSVCCHNNYPGTCISFSIFSMNTSAPRIPIPVCWHHFSFFFFFFFLKRFRYLYFYDCSVFTALYFSFIFWENSKDNAHLLFFNPPLTKKKKKWVRGERKKDKWNYFFSSILLFCNTYLEFQFLRLLTHFIIKISKPIRNMQWMVIYKHDKENKIGRGNCTACSAAILFINSDSSAPALIYFWWYKQDDFAV